MIVAGATAVMAKGASVVPDKFDLTLSDTHDADGGGLGGTYFVNGSYPGYRNTNGRTQVDAALVGGQKTAVIIVVGQSNGCSVSNTPYTPTSTLVHNLNIYDGGVYRYKDPGLGMSHVSITQYGLYPPCGSWLGRLGQKLIDAGPLQRVIMVPASMAGTWIGDWNPASIHSNYIRLRVALLRCFALGYTSSDITVIWHQGEGDSGSNTPQANYTNMLSNIISQSRTDGFSGKWVICTVSWNGGVINNNIRAAQAAVINHGAGIWEGADTDTLDNTWRIDTGHFSDSGMDQVAGLLLTKLQATGAPFV